MKRYPDNPEEISAFEAKTHLSELLRETEQGRSYLIKRRGKPVARLLPCSEPKATDLKALLAELRAIRAKVKIKTSVKNLIEEGRRF